MRSKILIVDDAVSVIETMAEVLSPFYEVSFATSGPRALDILRKNGAPDICLLDVMMPEMDGYELCGLIKRDMTLRDVPVVFITADTDPVSESRGLAVGAVDFINKPINRDVLLARVAVHLGLVLQRRELESLNERLVQSLIDVEQSRERLQVLATAMEYSPTSVVVTDAVGKIEYVNPHFERISGYRFDDVRGKNPSLLKSGETPAETFGDMWQHLKRGQPWAGELINRNQSGQLYREESHIAPVKDGDGRTSHYVAIQLDITARHEAEELVRLARRKELEISATIQQELLFGEIPTQVGAYTLANFGAASQILDGDFYTYTPLGDGSFEILVGDVMGKGMTAAMVGASVKNAYREGLAALLIADRSKELPSPAEIINFVHGRLVNKLIDLGVFVTLCLLRFDHGSNRLTWVNAGHTSSLLLRKAPQRMEELEGDNVPLGVLPEEVYAEHSLVLDAGDILCVYSDGLSEAMNPQHEQFGLDRIQQSLRGGAVAHRKLQDVLKTLQQDLDRFTQGAPLQDDTTVLLVQAG